MKTNRLHSKGSSDIAIPKPVRSDDQSARDVVRLQLFSDLHADVRAITPPVLAAGVDAVIVAGDTCQGPVRGFELLRRLIPAPTPIICIAGNHEFYRRCLPETIEQARSRACDFDITFLEDEATVVAGIRVLGCTLWTDYCLDGGPRRSIAMTAARSGMNDHRLISWSKPPAWRRFRPEDALAIHQGSRVFLERTFAEPFAGPSVVVTHHAPHPKSVDPRFALDPLNGCFASDLTDVIEKGRPRLWLHGHTHASADYRIGETRIVCNPHGYGSENPHFDPLLVLEVTR